MSSDLYYYTYSEGFQLAARGTHVAHQTIFVAGKAVGVSPLGLDFCSFIIYWTLKMEHPPHPLKKILDTGLLPCVGMWPAKYLPI
jgi:hypothetical protein